MKNKEAQEPFNPLVYLATHPFRKMTLDELDAFDGYSGNALFYDEDPNGEATPGTFGYIFDPTFKDEDGKTVSRLDRLTGYSGVDNGERTWTLYAYERTYEMGLPVETPVEPLGAPRSREDGPSEDFVRATDSGNYYRRNGVLMFIPKKED